VSISSGQYNAHGELEPIPALNLIFLGLCVCYAVDVASFFSANSWQPVTKENPVGFLQRIFMKRKVPNLHNYLDNNFQQVAKIKKLIN
jgi:hypothetical protein